VLKHLSDKSDEVLRSYPDSLTPIEEKKAKSDGVSQADALKAKQREWGSDRRFAINLIKNSGVPLGKVVQAIRDKEMAEVESVGKKEKTIMGRRQARARATKTRDENINQFIEAVNGGT
jgi:hypothetical protein